MPAESGHMKLLGNISKLLEFISSDNNYKPANPTLKVSETLVSEHN